MFAIELEKAVRGKFAQFTERILKKSRELIFFTFTFTTATTATTSIFTKKFFDKKDCCNYNNRIDNYIFHDINLILIMNIISYLNTFNLFSQKVIKYLQINKRIKYTK